MHMRMITNVRSYRWVAIPILTTLLPACGSATKSTDDSQAETQATAHREKAEPGEGAHEEHGEPREVRLSEAALRRAGLQFQTVEAVFASAVVLAPADLALNAERVATVGPRVSGRIAELHAVLGQSVGRGAILASIESPEVGTAAAAYLTAQAVEELARRTHEREKDLFARKIAAEREVLAAEAELARARAELRAAETRLRTLGLTADQIGDPRSAPGLLPVRTPIAGTVIERNATLGAPVGPSDVLFKVADLATLWLVAKVPETAIRNIRRGESVEVGVDALPDRRFSGQVGYIAPTVAPEARTVDVRIDVHNAERALRPGMFARARLASRSAGAADDARPLILRSAVQELNRRTVVFVPLGPGKFEIREVVLGQAFGNDVEILRGLTAGERIVTTGSFTLKAQAVRGAASDPH